MVRRPDRGMVTAELAAVFPVVVLLLGVLLGGVGLVIDQVRCVDAARLGARAAARGEPSGTVRALVRQAAPDGATVEVSRNGGAVRVSVRARARMVGALLPESFAPAATASAPLEVGGPAP
ncbi:TadE family type IV pilus minor pilin [Segeticoccus rhizosphaerae]|uniref:TadE family type IV pilus minor pilin n=1 Tax=Segeticoccus rhizosphaerae TaxID=1104777 RepID=UPI001EE3ECCE|nr:TadE family type IV pilus minor pilin [Ornithinicoccus soli]